MLYEVDHVNTMISCYWCLCVCACECMRVCASVCLYLFIQLIIKIAENSARITPVQNSIIAELALS